MNTVDALIPVIREWLSHPAGDPLVIQREKDGVTVTRGFAAPELTAKEAAEFFGLCYNTFRRRYVVTGRLTPSVRTGKFSARQVRAVKEAIG